MSVKIANSLGFKRCLKRCRLFGSRSTILRSCLFLGGLDFRGRALRRHHGGPVSAETPYSKEKDTLVRRGPRFEKRARGDTIEESSSVATRGVRDLAPTTHLQSDTSLHFHITTLSAHRLCSNGVWYRQRANFHMTISRSFRLKPGISHGHCRPPSVSAPLDESFHGGYAGVKLENQDQPHTRGIEQQKNRLGTAKSSKPAAIRYSGNADRSSSPSTTADAQLSRPTQTQAREQQQEYLRRAQCGPRSTSFQRSHGPQPHAAHGSEAWSPAAHA